MRIDFKSLNTIEKISVFICSLSFVGFLPRMPGTFGSLATIGIYYLIPDSLTLFYVMIISLILGISLSSVLDDKFEKDPSFIVIDEVAGMLIPLIIIENDIMLVIIAFILFRYFDIFKPLGINKLQDLPKGYGVMLDDILAGIYTLLIIKLILYV